MLCNSTNITDVCLVQTKPRGWTERAGWKIVVLRNCNNLFYQHIFKTKPVTFKSYISFQYIIKMFLWIHAYYKVKFKYIFIFYKLISEPFKCCQNLYFDNYWIGCTLLHDLIQINFSPIYMKAICLFLFAKINAKASKLSNQCDHIL